MTERFELLEEVGRGAMGVVWKARDNERGKIVAVKMLRDLHADDPEYIERFAREVDLARSVRSPHVVRVRGYGAREGAPFVVLEFVPGRSLRAHIAERGPFPPAEARGLLAQITEALAAVHAAGIVHRDVKASNVLLTEDGIAKLTDFGIARGRDPRGSTQKGSLLGTPAYMAPEGPVDARSDLYSLGVLYYELLSGALPFTSTNYHEVIRAHVETKPDLTRLPSSERGLTGWLLSKNPSERPRSAEALLASLRSSSAGSIRTPADKGSTSVLRSTRGLDDGAATRRGSIWTRSPTPTPTPTPTPMPTPTTGPTRWPEKATHWPTPQLRARPGDRRAVRAALAVGLVSLLTVGVVVFLAAGAGGSPATPGPVATQTAAAQGGSTGVSSALVAVAVLAASAVAITATLVMSRARAMAARDPGSTSPNPRGSRPNLPKPGGLDER